MTPRLASFKSKRFPNLYKYPTRSRNWVYRRFSPERDEDFTFSTGEEKNEKVAHDIGEAAYHKWLLLEPKGEGASGGPIYFGDFAKANMDRKLARPDSDFSKNSKRTSKNATRHLIEAFGRLQLDRINEDRWEDYVAEVLRVKPVKFFNRWKELNEIMRRAHRNGLIKRLPDFRNPDPKTDAGRALEDAEVQALLAAASPDTALLVEIIWRQGARPSEILAYEWDMIHWRRGKHGTIAIPGPITKTRREREIPLNSHIAELLRERKKGSSSRFIFPSPDTAKGGEFHIVEYKTGFNAAAQRAGIADVTIYDLRRTFATNQAEKGRDRHWVAKYMDTSAQMLERIYVKVQQRALQEIAE